MIVRKCEVCGKEFSRYPADVKRGKAKYCSVECRGMALRKRVEVACEYCGGVVVRQPSGVREHTFCSVQCMGAARRGDESNRRREVIRDHPGGEWLSIREAAEMVGLGEQSVHRAVYRGEVTAVKIGRSKYVEKGSLRAWRVRVEAK